MMLRFCRASVLVVLATGLSACTMIKTAAIKNVASTLAEPGDTFTSDDDPELVRKAIPFGLKLNESLLASVPKHGPLLLGTCAGFTGYAYAFVETDADLLSQDKNEQIQALRDEAANLYLRGKDYCMRAMEIRFAGIRKALDADPVAAVKRAKREDVPLLYWTAASWGSAMSLRKAPELVIDFPAVRALAERALALDESWNDGAIHELLLSLDSQGEAYGGSEEGARRHFTRAVEIQQGQLASPYVSLAMGVAYPKGDRAEFEKLMKDALAVDIQKRRSVRLVNIITQRRARALLDRIDELFPK